jgi:hypothetical protein
LVARAAEVTVFGNTREHFQDATTRQVSNPHGSPAQLSHELRQATACSRPSIALTDFEMIEQRLRGDPFDTSPKKVNR